MFVEIIGPAGSGKTTICKALSAKSDRITVKLLPLVQNRKLISFFVKNIFQILPSVIRSIVEKSDRKLTRRELAWMAILNGWPELLKKQSKGNQEFTILDQGPIFLTALLMGYGPLSLRGKTFSKWWQHIYSKWSQTLDLIVWLDASDQTLLTRVNERSSDHIMKGKTREEMSSFLATFRTLFEGTLNKIMNNNPQLQVIHIDSGQNSIEQVMEKILSQLEINDEE